MNLYLFPEAAISSNGYGIAVTQDYHKLNITKDDIVVWYTSEKQFDLLSDNHCIIKRPSKICYKRVINTLQRRPSSDFRVNDLLSLCIDLDRIENIFCGDVIFYIALREIFPEKKITVRFHNCFARIKDRASLLGSRFSLKFEMILNNFYHLERKIFSDNNVDKIFICNEDKDYYTSMMGVYEDVPVWGFSPNLSFVLDKRTNIDFSNKIVWFGGLDSHKKDSVDWFVNDVFPHIKSIIPSVELFLWGKGTEIYNNPDSSIYGHGFYNASDFPFRKEALYINPDLIGGGVKIKLSSYFEEGVAFISTPYGFEGYEKELIDNRYCSVVHPSQWGEYICDLLKNKTTL